MDKDSAILEKIYKASLKLLVPNTLDEVYSTIVDEAIKLVNADSGTIHLKQNGEFKVVYSTVPTFYSVKARKRGNVYQVFISQKTRMIDIHDVEKVHPQMRNLGIKSAILIPLSYQKKPLGVLAVNKQNRKLLENSEMRILVLFGSMASLAIRKAQLHEEVRRALETRDLFISMASHELKTPLTSVNGYIQLLQSRINNNHSPEGRWMEGLSAESFRLTQLVQELLEINRIRTGQLHYYWKECSLKEIIDRAIKNFQFRFPTRKVIFEDKLNGSDKIIGDFDKLLQVLDNLLENAAKYSMEDKKINLILKHQPSYLILIVQDHGYGIPQKDLEKIFDKFHRGSNSTREGMGLGLFLVKDIIGHHNSTVEISSKQNKGTKVVVKLPKAQYKWNLVSN